MFELIKDDRFNEFEKVEIMTRMFIDENDYSYLENLSMLQKDKIVTTIIEKFILDNENKGSEDESLEGENVDDKVYDLEEDAEYIYSSFLYDYGIDLFEQQGKLSWLKFKALLSNLSEDSKFMKVIGYRTMDIPKLDKYNQKERKRIIDLKRHYRLKSNDSVKKIDNTFNNLAKILISKQNKERR